MESVKSRPKDKDFSSHGLLERYREYSEGSGEVEEEKEANKGHNY